MRVCLEFDIHPDLDLLAKITSEDEIRAPSNYKDPIKIAEYKQKRFQEICDDAVNHPLAGVIESVGIFVGDDDEGIKTVGLDKAIDILNECDTKTALDAYEEPLYIVALNVNKRIQQMVLQGLHGGYQMNPRVWLPGERQHYPVVLLDPCSEAVGNTYWDIDKFMGVFIDNTSYRPSQNYVAPYASLPLDKRVRVLGDLCSRLGI